MNQTALESAKERLIQLYGAKNCKILVRMPSSEEAFSALRRSIEREFSKYKEKLPEDQYQQFIEEVFEIFKDYKSSLENVDEESYGQIFGDYAVKIAEIKEKYGV